MAKQSSFLTYVLEQLCPHGPIKARAMFGGYGIYYETTMFALIAEDQLYFRTDEQNLKDFERYGSEPFIYEGMKKAVAMPYFLLPEEILENSAELPRWIEKALKAAIRNKKKKTVRN